MIEVHVAPHPLFQRRRRRTIITWNLPGQSQPRRSSAQGSLRPETVTGPVKTMTIPTRIGYRDALFCRLRGEEVQRAFQSRRPVRNLEGWWSVIDQRCRNSRKFELRKWSGVAAPSSDPSSEMPLYMIAHYERGPDCLAGNSIRLELVPFRVENRWGSLPESSAERRLQLFHEVESSHEVEFDPGRSSHEFAIER